MMNMEYSYEIAKVDKAARCMEVVYTSQTGEVMTVGVRLPYEGERLETVIAAYSPVAYWNEKSLPVDVPEVGTRGSSSGSVPAPRTPQNPTTTLQEYKAAKLRELAAWRYDRETSGIVFDGTTISTDLMSQARLTAAFTSMNTGFSTEIVWKGTDGQWITLTAEKITELSKAVFAYVQECFALEKQYAKLIMDSDSIEQVNNIVFAQ